jgi:ribosomal protein S18 acetylase RimI-like enzyme
MDLRIDSAGPDDAGELLTLQRAAYVTEAQLYADPCLPPLTETLAELRAALGDGTTALAARIPTAPIPTAPIPTAPIPTAPIPTAQTQTAQTRVAEGLAARSPGGRLVGSVRARVDGDTCHIGRLVVVPDLQGRGIGRRLMAEVERRHAARVARFALFTGERSAANLRLYHRLGYREYARTPAGAYALIHLAKASG